MKDLILFYSFALHNMTLKFLSAVFETTFTVQADLPRDSTPRRTFWWDLW